MLRGWAGNVKAFGEPNILNGVEKRSRPSGVELGMLVEVNKGGETLTLTVRFPTLPPAGQTDGSLEPAPEEGVGTGSRLLVGISGEDEVELAQAATNGDGLRELADSCREGINEPILSSNDSLPSLASGNSNSGHCSQRELDGVSRGWFRNEVGPGLSLKSG